MSGAYTAEASDVSGQRETGGRRTTIIDRWTSQQPGPVARGTAEMGWETVVIHDYSKACGRCEDRTQRYGLNIT